MSLFLATIAAMLAAAEAPENSQVPAPQSETAVPAEGDADSARIEEAYKLIEARRPGEAMPILEELIERSEKLHASEKRQIFSARSLAEAFFYTALAQKAKKDVVVLNEDWSTAHFLKAFALIDLNRPDEAKPHLDRAISLAPMNAQFLAERGEWHKNRRDWSSAMADFEAASTAAEFSPDAIKAREKARALRGIGFVKIEQGELKEAEKLFKESLKLEPGNANARSELEYIKSLKRS